MEIFTKSAKETQKLGEKIATRLIQMGSGETARILALSGELGSGKTTFVQGLAKGFGLPHRILSPTFIISREYLLRGLPFAQFVHVDLYRLEKKTDLDSLGLQEIIANSDYIIAIEWVERLKQFIKTDYNLSFKETNAGHLITISEKI